MSKQIKQTVNFNGATPKELYDIYMDSKKHSSALGAPASIENRVGGKMSAFGEGHVIGKNLHLVPGQMIVQSWRGRDEWKPSDPDSILVLTFEKIAGGAKLSLSQFGVPERAFETFNKGWRNYYWKPWKKYLEKKHKK